MRNLLICGLLLCSFSGCGKVNDKLGEQAQVDIDKRNQDEANKVAVAEAELSRRHRFFQGAAGVYEGTYKTTSGIDVDAVVTLAPTIPPYTGSYKRSFDEVTEDLKKLAYNMTIVIKDKTSVVLACKFLNLMPEFEKGEIYALTDCNIEVDVYPSLTPNPKPDYPSANRLGKMASAALMNGTEKETQFLNVHARSSQSDANYWLHLTRVPKNQD